MGILIGMVVGLGIGLCLPYEIQISVKEGVARAWFALTGAASRRR